MDNNVIKMSDKRIEPKSESGVYKQTRYIIVFNPHAPANERWTYTIKYVRTYEYHGFASTITEARTKVRVQIASLLNREKRA